MPINRRRFLRATAALVALPVVSAVASLSLSGSATFAQGKYPEKPVRILVGFAAGGPSDIIARLVGDELSKALGQPVIVDYVPGAGGNIATERVAKAAPDGHTLLMAVSGMIVINPSLYKKLAYDTVKDLTPISLACFQPNVLVVSNDLPANSVPELVALARSRPGQLTFASAGVGTTQHLAGELFKSVAQVDIQHIAYRGITPAVSDLITGRVSMAFAASTMALPQVQEGKLRALAVTSKQRSPAAPDIPTMSEAGFTGFDASAWHGLMAPSGTPGPIIERLYRETARIFALPELRRKLELLGMEVVGGSPAEFAAIIESELPRWAKVIQELACDGNRIAGNDTGSLDFWSHHISSSP